jgi:hypothetical protein
MYSYFKWQDIPVAKRRHARAHLTAFMIDERLN